MLVLFAVILGGILTGRLFSSRRLVFVPRLITFIIWVLLFLLGLEIGSDSAVMGGLATLGRTAFVIFSFSVAGSIAAAWLLEKRIRAARAAGKTNTGKIESGRRTGVRVNGYEPGAAALAPSANGIRVCREPDSESPNNWNPDDDQRIATVPDIRKTAVGQRDAAVSGDEETDTGRPDTSLSDDGKGASLWNALRSSVVIVLFFVLGCIAGLTDLLPFDAAGSRVSEWALYALMFSVGISLGSDRTLAERVRRLDLRLALLPLFTAGGTLAGAAVAALFIAPVSLADSLAVGAGFGYYSLSSIFIADLRGAELGTVALLCNVMREIFTLLAAPLVARWFGPLAAVSVGGATSFDTTLPVITEAAGRSYAVVSVFHGCMLDFSVPFLVTLFCTIQ